MKLKLLSISIVFFTTVSLQAQIGIGNTNPQATLDITATSTASPANNDGILIPRMSNFPATPGATRDGMLIFYTGTGASGKGFYYWNQTTTSWVSMNGTSDADWYGFGTTTPPSSNTDNIYNSGQVQIGIGPTSSSDSKLSVIDTDDTLNAGIFVNRFHTNNTAFGHNGISQFTRLDGSGGYSGMNSTLQSTTTSTGTINNYNAVNNISRGNGFATNTLYRGTFNSNTGTSTSANSYGAFIEYSANATSAGNKYGYYIDINSSLPATHYGVYSDVQKASGYAGYFLGRTSLGTGTTDRYLMPGVDGTTGQVMTTDGAGNIGWVDPSTLPGSTEWTDNGTYLSPSDGTNEDVSIGSVSASPARLNVTTTKTEGIEIQNNYAGTNASFGIRNFYAGTSTGFKSSIQNYITTSSSGTQTGVYNYLDNNSASDKRGILNTLAGNSDADMFGVNNGISTSGSGTHYGTRNHVSGDGSGLRYAVYNRITGSGTGERYGMYNYILGNTGNANQYGVRNYITNTGTGNKYGTLTEIATSAGGTHYGLYSSVLKANSWAGYFLGNVSIGTTTSNIYTFPASRGTNGEVMQTDAAGNISWVDPATIISGNTLDQAYDQGGAGAGRTITADTGAVLVNGLDGFITSGTYGSGATLTRPEGSRMFFYPKKAAFRAGYYPSPFSWSETNIGNISTAFGYLTMASGESSTAMGTSTLASGYTSTAMGSTTIASGQSSTAMGRSTRARSYAETAIGINNNDTTPNSTSAFDASDQLFSIGNGTNGSNRSNALTIYKSGLMNINDAYNMPLTDGAANQVMATNGSGIVSFVDATSLTTGNTLDQAYDQGGPGAGRTITANDGAVLINGLDGFQNTGAFGGGNTLSLSGDGTRMFFYPRKAAFRAGSVTGTRWDDANIGNFSTAMGLNTTASGINSTAMGYTSTASGSNSLAMGSNTTASGNNSTAMGLNTIASGINSTAVGHNTTASSVSSMAMGYNTTASSVFSTAMGFDTTASGDYSTAMGSNTTASGDYSSSMGLHTNARTLAETAIGQYITFSTLASGTSSSTFYPNDRLFVIGNGTTTSLRSNALTIYKNGLMNINDSYNMPLTDGSANQVMTTDGAGNVSFSTITGEITTASNGLTEIGNDILLGGLLTLDTSIFQGTFDIRFNLNDSGDFIIQDNGTNKLVVLDNGDTVLGGDLYWRDESTSGTVLGRMIDNGDDGRLEINENGTASILLDANGETIFNEQGLDRDFRIESDGTTDMFFVDASTNRVGIGTATPDYNLSVTGTLNLREDIATGGAALRVNGTEALWFDGNLFSWGYGGTANFFNDAVGIGINAPSYKFDVRDANAGDYVAQIFNTSTNANADGLKIRVGNTAVPTASTSYVAFFDGNNTVRGRIQGNGTGVTYNTTSDRRLKTNISNIDNALNLIDKIQPRRYEYKTNLGIEEFGFIAQELQPLYPQAVTGTPNSDAETDPMMVDYSRLTPLLTAGIKELKEEVNQLKSENETLKAQLSKFEQLEARLSALENDNPKDNDVILFSKN